MIALCGRVQEVISSAPNMMYAVHTFLAKNGFYGSFIAAISVAAILFFIKEFFNPSKVVNGNFYVLLETRKSAYRPYIGMVVERQIVIYSDGHSVKGSTEKTREQTREGMHEYIPTARVRGVVDGFIERNYIKASKLHLHIVENNTESRESTSYVTVKIGRWNRKILKGEFYSTAADCAGAVSVCKEKPESLSI
ncbi:hypothetical protein [Achromobacter marplatensis]|jgi:hypothetical protein|uniref:hypothetical protein n=1 Tax=Achromobacter marplatensis TaxID=470868 RepID=UPI003C740B1E